MIRLALLVLLVGCGHGTAEPLDLSEALDPGEARAGVLVDDRGTFAGISAEAQPGDVLIYNSRVRFVIQGTRDGDYYVSQGGSVVDADIVRPPGQLGHDSVDEWAGMYGFGRLLQASQITVIDDGSLGGSARVHVVGHESPMELLTGALGSPGLLADQGMDLVVDYELEPDSNLLHVTTTMTATQQDLLVQPGDALMGALEVVETYDPQAGRGGRTTPRPWTGLIGYHDDVAMAIVPPTGAEVGTGVLDALGGAIQISIGMGDTLTIPVGTSATYTRDYAVGADLAEITDAILVRDGVATEPVTGTVTAEDGPVAGARVNVLVDDEPYTLAVTGADGSFTANVPAGSQTRLLADGRGQGYWLDLPEGTVPYAPYASETVRNEVLAAFVDGADPVPYARGYGAASEADPLTLHQPGFVTVDSGDGLPFEVRLEFTAADAPVDPRLVQDRPSGYQAIGWARDGSVRMAVEPGEYRLIAHRGIRYEQDLETIVVTAGQDTAVDVDLPVAYVADGWMLGDPHMHASPSGDTSIPMEDRLIGAAGVGLQLHFGTDHDHIAAYEPLVQALGLGDSLGSVLADEMSPVLRGHMNMYPLTQLPGEPNGGAWRWWHEQVESTQAQFDLLRGRHGDFVLQSNHPTGQGLANAAGWAPGTIANGDKWSTDFDAVEILNSGDLEDFDVYFWDLATRGIRATPVGVSDSHGRTAGSAGCSSTFIEMGSDDPRDYQPDTLREAIRAGRTVATRGPFIRLTGASPGDTVTGSVEISAEAMSPSWIVVNRIELIRDGVIVETVEGTSATFTLDPDTDAVYAVQAQGDEPMGPIYNKTPWAMTAPIYVDVAGDGWTPPLPPLQVTP